MTGMTDPQDARAGRDGPLRDAHDPGYPGDTRDPGDTADTGDTADPGDTANTSGPDGDVLDEILANHAANGGAIDGTDDGTDDGTGGFGDPDASGLSNDDALDRPATGDHEVGAQPVELDADAMGRPLPGSANDDDQGMENAGDNAGF